jgi:selenocysteine lyase/cysteine desulfurase
MDGSFFSSERTSIIVHFVFFFNSYPNFMWFCDMQDTLYYDDIEEREDAGTPPIIQKIRASLAFWVKEYIGYETMSLRERVYSEMAMKKACEQPKCKGALQHKRRTRTDLLLPHLPSGVQFAA